MARTYLQLAEQADRNKKQDAVYKPAPPKIDKH
jgi:hypothetical protein